jgi:D-methionine transport system ATP-binding protein
MTCCISWLSNDPFAMLENVPCNDCILEDVPYLREPPPIPPGPVVRLGNVSKSFGRVLALDDVTFEVQRGEILGIIGRSGAGKSTLIRCLNGLEKPDRGLVEVLGLDIAPLPEHALRNIRGRIGMVFQHFNLLSAKTVSENIALPLKIASYSTPERHARVRELLALVGLSDKAEAYPAKLSGGQKQRVGIARALAAHPALLLCDEATSALDPETTQSILDLLRSINRRLGLTIVLITHEMSVVRAIADRVVVMDNGAIIEEGEAWQVFAAPEAELTHRLLGGGERIPAEVRSGLRLSWSEGSYLIVRVHLDGAAVHRPVLAAMTRDLDVLPVLLDANVQHVRNHPIGSFTVAFRDGGEALIRRIGGYLAAHALRLEVLGYVSQLA